MIIGYFVTDFPYKNPHSGEEINRSFYGGVGNVAYNLAIAMIKRGHKVYIFTSSLDSKDSIEKYGELVIYRYKSNFMIGDSPCSIGLIYKPLFLKLSLDIVHIHAGNPPSTITGYLYSRIYKIPLVVSYHGDVILNFGTFIRKSFVYFYGSYLLPLILGYSNTVISPSINYIAGSPLLSRFQKKISVIPNGINLSAFNILLSKDDCKKKLNLPLDKKVILFLGGLNPHKNPEVLLNAMPSILMEKPDTLLLFVGDGGLREKLENLSITLGLGESVLFAGYIEEELKPLYYKSSDIFCLTSIREPFGIVNLEAMASGIPIVASNCGGVLDFVQDGKNGFLASPQDSRTFSENILTLLKDDYKRLKMGYIGKQMSVSYSWDKISKLTEDIYIKLTSANKH
ncbi:MAG: glycosyltransferase family 4 protein [Methanolobus sp.]|uniref:glycosyltransferase family 4 protein n=1 Tax=Methanolobus sp. TaxID=1874737 RepID=UPI00272F49FB|nr:glycosyltransferase family 4 protein [Methanolobus sp.]MDP2218009.1 glycosyltransferase family 4 protein [Methanolobus sp.]